jgi:hypothetical protein
VRLAVPATKLASRPTGRLTNPAQPEALEKEEAVSGTLISVVGAKLTVQLEYGTQRTFHTDVNTFFFRIPGTRFFRLPEGVDGISPGTSVLLRRQRKDGMDYISSIAVGDGGFIGPSQQKKAVKGKSSLHE